MPLKNSNLVSGKNATSFSANNQPKNKGGRKKISEARKLMKEFGRSLAPADIRNDETVAHFLEQNNMKGTVHEVLIARLYALALYGGNIKAFELIFQTLEGSNGGGKNALQINFISPPALTQEEPIDLSSDSWTVSKPGESASD